MAWTLCFSEASCTSPCCHPQHIPSSSSDTPHPIPTPTFASISSHHCCHLHHTQLATLNQLFPLVIFSTFYHFLVFARCHAGAAWQQLFDNVFSQAGTLNPEHRQKSGVSANASVQHCCERGIIGSGLCHSSQRYPHCPACSHQSNASARVHQTTLNQLAFTIQGLASKHDKKQWGVQKSHCLLQQRCSSMFLSTAQDALQLKVVAT